LNHRQEDPFGGFAEVAVFLRRLADDGGLVDRVLSMGDGRYVEYRKEPGWAVEPGVVTERALGGEFGLVDISF
jgi:hypothetical protein